jgi:hypothetical protein
MNIKKDVIFMRFMFIVGALVLIAIWTDYFYCQEPKIMDNNIHTITVTEVMHVRKVWPPVEITSSNGVKAMTIPTEATDNKGILWTIFDYAPGVPIPKKGDRVYVEVTSIVDVSGKYNVSNFIIIKIISKEDYES